MGPIQSISFFERFWPAVSSLIVALILFLIGVLMNRWRQKKKQEKLYVSVLRSIHYDFKKNLDLLCQLHFYLFLGILPSFSLELSRKDGLVQTLIPVCLRFKLLDRISDGYFEMVHIQNRLDQLRGAVATDKWSDLLAGTRQLICNDISSIFEILHSITQEINRRTHKTEDILDLPEDYLKQKFDEWQRNSEIVEITRRQGRDLSGIPKFYHEASTLRTKASGSAPP